MTDRLAKIAEEIRSHANTLPDLHGGARSALLAIADDLAPEELCPEEIEVAHETFDCCGQEGHSAPHYSILDAPYCQACGGWNEHAPTCQTLDGYSGPELLVTARWTDDDACPTITVERPVVIFPPQFIIEPREIDDRDHPQPMKAAT